MKSLSVFLAVFFLIHPLEGKNVLKVRRHQRQVAAHTVKAAVAEFDESKSIGKQTNNGDQELYSDLRGSFGKGLDHFSTGFIMPEAFQSLVKALRTGKYFDLIQLGEGRRLVNPQGSFVYSLAGNDGWVNTMPPAPAFDSAETAAEMVELYWTALVRDVAFNDFSTDVTVALAVNELNQMKDFKGPKINGQVTPQTFLRGNAPGELVGPYISQFLYQDVPYGTTTIPPEQTVPTASVTNDFNTDFTDWFTTINGGDTGKTLTLDGTKHFLRTPRDLGEYVHLDSPGQSAMNAALILLSYGAQALDPNCPYLNNPTQEGFITFGIGDILYLVRVAVEEGLKAAWFQKWQVHLRLRPEEYGFYVQEQKVNGQNLGINSQLLDSQALIEINTAFSSYFLPVAYPEGSPTHPSYPAGHATLMGAAVTILKAVFNEDFVIPLPLEPNAANDTLVAYAGTPLTVGGELNKLASNISLGRDHAGVHYRSDGWQGMLLGEKVALDILNNQSFLFNEDFKGYHLTTFQGEKIIVGGN